MSERLVRPGTRRPRRRNAARFASIASLSAGLPLALAGAAGCSAILGINELPSADGSAGSDGDDASVSPDARAPVDASPSPGPDGGTFVDSGPGPVGADAVAPVTPADGGLIKYDTLTPNLAPAVDRCGAAVAFSADGLYLAVGCPGTPAVEIYEQSNGGWGFLTSLTPDVFNVKAADFGGSLAWNDAVGTDAQLLIGAPGAMGKAFIVSVPTTSQSWTLVHTLTVLADASGPNDFATSVGFGKNGTADVALVGVPSLSLVDVYPGPTFADDTPIYSSATGNGFGTSLATGGGTVDAFAIGEPEAAGGGSVTLGTLGGGGSRIEVSGPSAAEMAAHFGAAVALGAGYLVVGAPGQNTGTVYIYEDLAGIVKSGAGAAAVQLAAPTPTTSNFGTTLALGPTYLAVSATNQVYLYPVGASGISTSSMSIPLPAGSLMTAQFGASLAFTSSQAAVGTVLAVGAPGSGAVYLFH